MVGRENQLAAPGLDLLGRGVVFLGSQGNDVQKSPVSPELTFNTKV